MAPSSLRTPAVPPSLADVVVRLHRGGPFRRLSAHGLASALVAAVVCSSSAWAQASFQPLGDLPGGAFNSVAFGVSSDGATVVGLGAAENHQEAFVWTEADGMQGLGAFGTSGYALRAEGISSDGTIVGLAVPSPVSVGAAFAWNAGAIRDVGDLPGGSTESWAWDISDTGVIVGTSSSGTGEEAFRADEGGMIGLGVLPGGPFAASNGWGVSADGTTVVGRSRGANGWEAYRWTEANGMVGLGALPNGGFECSEAFATSADGSVVVGFSCSPSGSQAFRWTAGDGMVVIGPGFGFGVSADGSVVVGDANGAFVWTQAEGMRSLQGALASYGINLNGWTLLTAEAVSADGSVIVGAGRNPMGDIEAFRAVLPRVTTASEPAVRADIPRLAVAPNPATGDATLTLDVPRVSSVRLEVLDVLGRVVARPLESADLGAGQHTVPLDTARLGGGLYVVRLTVGSEVVSRSLSILR